MEITEKNVGDVCVVALSGRLDANCADEVEQTLNPFIDSAKLSMVVNFANLACISSSGLRVLPTSLKKVRKRYCDIKLSAMHTYIKEVFDIAGFTQPFNHFDTEDAAIDAFKEVSK